MTNPKPTDTSRSGDLVERLRDGVLYGDARLHNPKGHDPLRMEAADRIEALEMQLESANEALREQLDIRAALEAENERLREAVGILEDGLQEVGDDYPGSSCQEWCQHQIKQARAALKEISNGDR